MSVLETPSYDDWPVPSLGSQRHGYLVWLRIDHEASVRCLEDEETSHAVSLLPRDWFLGFILEAAGVIQFNDAGDLLLDFAFGLLGEGPSDVRAHSIPVAPAPQLTDERPPIELTHPLPWSNLYVHTHVMSGGIVSRIHHGTGRFEPVLPEAQAESVFKTAFMDLMMHNNALATAAAAAMEATSVGPPAVPADARADHDSGHETSSQAESLKVDTRSIDDKFQLLRAHVELWLDPSSYPGPPTNPEAWTTAMDRLKVVWDEWRDRRYEEAKTSGARKADAWLQGVQATSQLPHDNRDPPSEPPLDDGAVLPEDAVDYRLEQERARGSSPSLYDPIYEEWKNDTHELGQLAGPLMPQGPAALLDLAPHPSLYTSRQDEDHPKVNGERAPSLAAFNSLRSGPTVPSPLLSHPNDLNIEVAPVVEAAPILPLPTAAGPAPSLPPSRRPSAAHVLSKVSRWPIKVVRGAVSNLKIGFTRLKDKTGRKSG